MRARARATSSLLLGSSRRRRQFKSSIAVSFLALSRAKIRRARAHPPGGNVYYGGNARFGGRRRRRRHRLAGAAAAAAAEATAATVAATAACCCLPLLPSLTHTLKVVVATTSAATFFFFLPCFASLSRALLSSVSDRHSSRTDASPRSSRLFFFFSFSVRFLVQTLWVDIDFCSTCPRDVGADCDRPAEFNYHRPDSEAHRAQDDQARCR